MMGLLESSIGDNPAKEDLLRGLISGDISHRFEVLREFTDHEGGRNILGNSLGVAWYAPWPVAGIIFIIAGFIALFNPDSEVPILVSLCCAFPSGFIATAIGIAGLKDTIGEMANPDDYVKYEVTVYFNRRERYLAEVSVILDATDEDIIGDITFVDEITLSKKSRIHCSFRPGSDGAVRPDFNNFLVEHGDVSIYLDGHTRLGSEKRLKLAEEWSEKLGVDIGEPLVQYVH